MKKAVSILVALVLLCTATVPAVAAGECSSSNLVKNPGFEDNLNYWQPNSSDAKILTDKDQTEEYGDNFLFLFAIKKAVAVTQDINVELCGTYRLSCVAKSINSIAKISVKTSDNEYEMSIPDNDSEIEFTTIFTVEEPSVAQISIKAEKGGGAVFDNISLSRTNLLNNNSFELNLNGWEQVGSSNFYTTDVEANTGKQSLYMGYFESEKFDNYIEQGVNICDIGTYELSAFIKPDKTLSGDGAVLIMEARDSEGKLINSSVSYPTKDSTKGWQLVQISIDVPEGTVMLTAKIGGIYCTGAFYVDDVFLTKLE